MRTTPALALTLLLAGCGSKGSDAPWVLAPVALAPSVGQVVDLATDGTWVAWCTHRVVETAQKKQVSAVPLAGGPVIDVFDAGCSAVALHGGVVAWSAGGAIWVKPLPAGEARTLDAGEIAVADVALDATHVYALREHDLIRVPLAGGAPETLWSVPIGSVGDEVVLGKDSVWLTITDDEARYGTGSVGIFRISTTGGPVGGLPVKGKRAAGLRVVGDRVVWIADAAAWEMPATGGPPLLLYDQRPDAIDAHGFYLNPRPLGKAPMRYVPHLVGWPRQVTGVAQHIAPVPGGFVASFPRIEIGEIVDVSAPGAAPHTRQGPVPSKDHGTIGVVRWTP